MDLIQSPKTLIKSSSRGPFSDELAELNPPAASCSSRVLNTDNTPEVGNSNFDSSNSDSSNSDSSDSESLPSTPTGPMIPASPKHSSPPRCGSEEGEDHAGSPKGETVTDDVEKSSPKATPDFGEKYASPYRSPWSSSFFPERRNSFSRFEKFKNPTSPFDCDEFSPTPRFPWSFNPRTPPPVGAGLANMGNTCFLNAVFQCFTHTVPFVQRLLDASEFPIHHGTEEFCALAAVQKQMRVSLSSPGKTLFPRAVVDNLSHFSSFFEINQQEDAHEFLQCLLDKLDSCLSKSALSVENKPPSPSSDTMVKEVFGGRLVSQLCCSKCGNCSKAYEPVIDLSLEIDDDDVHDLDGALKSFTKEEKLDEVTITCDSCKEQVSVEKQLKIDQAPSVIALHLKRFKTDGCYVEKIDKRVEYPLELSLAPYTTGDQKSGDELTYELYAFVEHMGWSSTSGHYISYVRSSPLKWYRFDDSEVKQVSIDYALSKRAYILFYAKKGTAWPCTLVEAMQCGDRSTSPSSVLDFKEPLRTASADGAGSSTSHVTENRDVKAGRAGEDTEEKTPIESCAIPSYSYSLHGKTEEKTLNEPSASPLSSDSVCDETKKSDQESSKCLREGKSLPIGGGESDKVENMVSTDAMKEGHIVVMDDFMCTTTSDGDEEICASINVGKSQPVGGGKEPDKVDKVISSRNDVKKENKGEIAMDDFMDTSDGDEDMCAGISLKREAKIGTGNTTVGQASPFRSRSPDLYYEKPAPEVQRHPTPNYSNPGCLASKNKSKRMDRERKMAMRSMQRHPKCRRNMFQALLFTPRSLNMKRSSPSKKRISS